MNHGLAFVLAQSIYHGVGVANVCFDDRHIICARNLTNPIDGGHAGIDEIVYNYRRISSVQQLDTCVRADISSPPRHENPL